MLLLAVNDKKWAAGNAGLNDSFLNVQISIQKKYLIIIIICMLLKLCVRRAKAHLAERID